MQIIGNFSFGDAMTMAAAGQKMCPIDTTSWYISRDGYWLQQYKADGSDLYDDRSIVLNQDEMSSRWVVFQEDTIVHKVSKLKDAIERFEDHGHYGCEISKGICSTIHRLAGELHVEIREK